MDSARNRFKSLRLKENINEPTKFFTHITSESFAVHFLFRKHGMKNWNYESMNPVFPNWLCCKSVLFTYIIRNYIFSGWWTMILKINFGLILLVIIGLVYYVQPVISEPSFLDTTKSGSSEVEKTETIEVVYISSRNFQLTVGSR